MKKKISAIIISLFSILLFSSAVSAASTPLLTDTTALNDLTNTTAKAANFGSVPLETLIGNILKIALGLLAVIFLALIVVAGFGWMTAQGGEEQVKKSQSSMQNAIIGLIITLAAYSLTLFILPKIDTSNTANLSFATSVATTANLSSTPLANVIATIIKVVLGFLATIFLVLIVIAGFQWMTAGGNEEQIKSARSRMVNAIIGLVIVLMAYAITYFIFQQLPFGGGGGTGTATI